MNRRNFIHAGSLSGIGLMIAPASGARTHRYLPAIEFEEITIAELQEKMQRGTASSVSITKSYIDRIKSIDREGPQLRAVLELNPDALAIAASMDKERKQGHARGPLHGIPVLVKDNINTADKMMTTAGALALVGNVASEDAFIIQRLRAAGAVLLGKTNLSEWANFRSSHSTSAWSSRGGQTKCPYLLDRNPSGSSAGSGSATAANLCAVSIGTETDGSIVSPSSVNGLVGIKPTVGLWSRSGIIPISATQDTAGPMARTVRDAAVLLGALTGVDRADAVTAQSDGKYQHDYTTFLDKNGLKGKRIGVEKSHLDAPSGLGALFRNAIAVLKQQGAAVVEVELMKAMKAVPGGAEFQVLLYEFKDGVNRYLSKSQAKVKNLQEVIAFNTNNEPSAMPFFKQETLELSQSKGDLQTKEYTDALAQTTGSRAIITDLMKQFGADALAGITNGPACCIDLVNGDYDTGPSFSTPAAISGYPHITVPMGMVHGLPVGLSFMANAYAEPQLLAMAFAYEQASMMRKKPSFNADLLG